MHGSKNVKVTRMLEMFCVTHMSVVWSVVGEWSVIMDRRWKDTDKREQNCLRETI